MLSDFHFLRPEPPASGVENMRRDWELLCQAEDSAQPMTWVRIYGWDRATVSLGKHQKAETAVSLEACRLRGIPVVYRPTGGRAVLHADEITYAVVSNRPAFLGWGGVSATYELISRGLVEGLKRLGIQTDLVSGRGRSRETKDLITPCFATPSRAELTWQRRKIAGSAQRRLKRAFLQHGSLPLTIDYDLMGQVFSTPAAHLRSTICSLAEALDRLPSFGKTRLALQAGFREVLAIGSPWREYLTKSVR